MSVTFIKSTYVQDVTCMSKCFNNLRCSHIRGGCYGTIPLGRRYQSLGQSFSNNLSRSRQMVVVMEPPRGNCKDVGVIIFVMLTRLSLVKVGVDPSN
jgi:hypothetical protein